MGLLHLLLLLLVGCGFEEAAAEFAAGSELLLADQRSSFPLPWWSIIMSDLTTTTTTRQEQPELAGHQAVEDEVEGAVDECRHVHQLSQRCVTVHEELRHNIMYNSIKNIANV